jgi:hypothetical protein
MTTDEFTALTLRNRFNLIILARLHQLKLSDAWLVSGALFQTVWNILSDHRPEYGIKDYDIFYFDRDTSWQAEDAAIRHAKSLFADLGVEIELRNQARVHLWYEEKFGAPYPPLSRSTEGIDRFLQVNAQVGIQPDGARLHVYAPGGFDDIEQMRVRPNLTPNFQVGRYEEKARRWKTLWPQLAIEAA